MTITTKALFFHDNYSQSVVLPLASHYVGLWREGVAGHYPSTSFESYNNPLINSGEFSKLAKQLQKPS